jgi:hypothetical protein
MEIYKINGLRYVLAWLTVTDIPLLAIARLHRPGWPKKGTDIPCLVLTLWLWFVDWLDMDIVKKAITIYIILGMDTTDTMRDS